MTRKLRCCTLLIVFFSLFAVQRIDAQTVQSNLWVTNGLIYSLVRNGNTIYLGGSFSYAGPNFPYGAAFKDAAATPDLSFAKPNGVIMTAVPDGSGGWYIGGEFTQVGGINRKCIARINADGSVHDWNPGA